MINKTQHEKIGLILSTSYEGGHLSYHVKSKRMVFANQWGEVSYPQMTKDNYQTWRKLVDEGAKEQQISAPSPKFDPVGFARYLKTI